MKTSCVSIIHETVHWNDSKSMPFLCIMQFLQWATFFLERCAHFDFIFILFLVLQNFKFPPLFPFITSLRSLFFVALFLQKHNFANSL